MIGQSGIVGSPGSCVPLPSVSSNLRPDLVGWLKLPKSLPSRSTPDWVVNWYPAVFGPGHRFVSDSPSGMSVSEFGNVWMKFAPPEPSHTRYVPGPMPVKLYVPSAAVSVVACCTYTPFTNLRRLI